MSQKREKGKIAHGEWQKIVARYESGDTITQIGRDYGCTAPAIRYIVRKSGKLRDAAPSGSRAPMPHRVPPRSELPAPRAGRSRDDRGDRPQSVEWQVPPRTADRGLFGLELRKRVTGDVAAFLVAFDQANATNAESLDALQDATDRLMRASARVRIEIERLLVREVGSDDADLATSFAARGVARA